MMYPVRSQCLAAILAVGALGGSRAAAQVWSFKGVVAQGDQCDAARGILNRIHLVTSRYYQFDANGNQITDEAYPGADTAQGAMENNPAIAVDRAGNAHIISRRNGNYTTGYELWYSKRMAVGTWSAYLAATPMVRNYQVGIAAAQNGKVYFSYGTSEGNVWGPVKFYRENGGAMTFLGDIRDVWRNDDDQIIRARGNTLFFGSGKCDSGGAAYFGRAVAVDNPVAALSASLKSHSSGSDRKGFPALMVDAFGNYHVAYGASGEVYYNKYNASNAKVFASDKRVFSGLGAWHLNSGLCAITASDDGQRVLIVALNPDGKSNNAANADLLYSYSLDGGASWSPQARIGRYTNAGEGRLRPALVWMSNKAFLFYRDTTAGGTSLAILEARRPGTAGIMAAAAPREGAGTEYEAWAATRIADAARRDPGADPDGDGVDNRSEFVADTNPDDRASRLTLRTITSAAGVTLSFSGSAARVYSLQTCEDIVGGNWRDVSGQSELPGSDAVMTVRDDAPAASRCYYRLHVMLPP